MLLADGFEKAFMGIAIPNANSEEVAVYDYYKCIEILKERDGMSEDDAVEFFYYNVVGAYVGKYTPIFYKTATIKEVNESCDYYG